MTKAAQRRAVASNRRRLRERGMSRYEVRGRDDDKELVRELARRLSDGDSGQLRAELTETLGGPSAVRGGVLAALRRSPLVGAGVKLKRPVVHGRGFRL